MINKSGHTKKKIIIAALEQSLGVITTACKKADVPRSTFYKWYNEDQQFKSEVDDIQEITLDFAESQLFKQIKENNTTATIFFLTTKGKNRGYIERQEIQHSGEIKEIIVNVKTAQTEDDSEH
jgi:hypothetical protein